MLPLPVRQPFSWLLLLLVCSHSDACPGQDKNIEYFLGCYVFEKLNPRVGVSEEENLGIVWVPGHSLFPRTTRFASFPDYLVIQIKKFTFGLDWVPKKLGMVAGISEGG